MAVSREPPILLSPSHPTPLSPPLTLSPLDASMLHHRLDFLYVYDKRAGAAAAAQHAAAAAAALQPSLAARGRHQQHSFSSSPSHSSPRHYHISPPLSSSFMCLPHLQQSLRDTLSDYHVLAGRLTVNAYSQQAIRLTDDGVGWTTARSELTLDEILPSPLQRLDAYDSGAVPAGLMTSLPATFSSSSPLLQLQYTLLGCGSVCLAVSVYHGVMDAKALFLFMNCWSQQSRGKRYTRPSHERHVLTNMRAAATTCITHDEYMVVARLPKPAQPPTPVLHSAGGGAAGQAAMMPRSLSAGGGGELSLGPAGSVSRSSSRAEMAMRTFHFSRLEIERMKRSVLECQSPSLSSSTPSVLFSPPQTPTAFSLPPAVVSPSHSAAAAAGSRTIFSPLSPPLSGPTSPRLSSTLHNPPYHPDYVSTFDVLAAHVWQLVMRARFPQLVSTLPPPPPPPPSSLSMYEIGTAALSPTQSRPSTPVRAFSSSASSVTSPAHSAQSRQPAMPTSASFTQAHSSSAASMPSSTSASSFVTLLPPAAASSVVTHLAIAFNGRNRLEPPLPDVFCGNVTFFAIVPSPLPVLLTAPLHALTRAIRSRMNGMVGEYLRSALTILSSPPPPHSRLVPSFDTKGPDVLMTSWLTCEVYAADFGYGRPDWVGVAGGEDKARWEGYVCMIRAGREEPAAAAAASTGGAGRGGGIEVIPPGDASRAEGVDVVVCLKEEEMRRLLADERLRCWRSDAQRRSEGGGRQNLGMLMEAMEHLELQSADAHETRMQEMAGAESRLPYRSL